MDIAIIGAGHIGGTLARKLAGAGHRVRLANSKAPTTLTEFGDEPGITAMWSAEAADGADLAILAIPERGIESIPAPTLAALAAVPVVIDTGNYYPGRDGRIDAIDQGLTDSEWVESRIGRPVFKVFNNITAPSLEVRGTAERGQQTGATVAGADGEGKDLVFSLVEQLGFEPVDAGPLNDSWRVQPGTPSYCKNMDARQLRQALAETRHSDVPSHQAIRDQVDFGAAATAMRESTPD